MSLRDEIQRDIESGQEKDFPAVLIWQGEEFPCSKSSVRKQKNFDLGGGQYPITASVTVRMNAVSAKGVVFSDLPKQPRIGANIMVDGTTYAIDSIDDGHGAKLTMALVDPNSDK